MVDLGTPAAIANGSVQDYVYASGAGATYTLTGDTNWHDIDNISLVFTFTAPDNGVAWIEAVVLAKANGCNLNFALREAGVIVAQVPAGYSIPEMRAIPLRFRVAGLTPGSSHTYTLAWNIDNAADTATMFVGAALGAPFQLRVTQGK